MRPFSLLIKPAGADCNLRCEYCFYLDKRALYPAARSQRMPDQVLERLIQGYMATRQPVYTFGWQGGEPTLMGVDFFKKITRFQQRYGRPHTTVANGVQTNATQLDDGLAAHWAEYNFLVGCSLDGPPERHNQYRRTALGTPTHAAVMRGIDILRRHRVEFNILVLVTQANARHAAEVYHYLTEQGFLYHQYIPCVEFDPQGRLQPFAVDSTLWGRFNIELFDAWQAAGDTHRVSIRHFDAIVHKLVDGTHTLCSLGRDCRQYFVVEHNGDIYPCDFFVDPRLKLGNIMSTSWSKAQDSPVYKAFGIRKSAWSETCVSCRHLDLCAGDCLKHRPDGADGEPPLTSVLCAGWDRFYTHARAGFESLARSVCATRATSSPRPRPPDPGHPIGSANRNDPCPCGSGRKFKKCCGACSHERI